MPEPILCLLILIFLGWVTMLRTQIQQLKEDKKKLRAKLELGVHEITEDVEVVKGHMSWGKKSDDHLMHVGHE